MFIDYVIIFQKNSTNILINKIKICIYDTYNQDKEILLFLSLTIYA